MTQLRQSLFVAAVLLGLSTCQVAQAQVEFIDPVINIPLPVINFDANINPVPGTLSGDALNIIRAHRVALQQVQAAIQYLRVHRNDILAGENAWYNETFGDFYDPDSPFAGLYNRILKHDTGRVDRFNNPIYEDWYNTAHYDRVLFVFTQIEAALKDTITYAYGAQVTAPNTQDPIFDTYRNGALTVGDPLFGSPSTPDNISPIPIDPLTGLPFVDPVTGLPYTNQPLLGDPLVSHMGITLPAASDRGTVQWGFSTSFTPEHLNQIATNPTNPLSWDDDNDLTFDDDNDPLTPEVALTPEQQLAFFNDRLDAYAVTDSVTGDTTVYVGGAFLNESQRSDSTPTGEPNPFFHPTEFNQYQQIVMALAQSEGSQAPSSGTGSAVSIENGIASFMGASSYFFQALDGRSYASFVDVFKPIEEGGIGDGSLLPPPGKAGSRSSVFIPLVPGS